MAANLDTKNLGNCLPIASHEDELVLPISYQPGNHALFAVVQINGNSLKLYPPSRALLAPIREETEAEIEDTDQERGPGENADDHSSVTVTIPETRICRICYPDEETTDGVLVELGCHCKGPMSRMHRKCILKWYGVRMTLQNNYKCEICKAFLHSRVQLQVFRSVADHVNGGRDILITALKSELGQKAPRLNIESATSYDELLHLLHVHNAMQPLTRTRARRHHHIIDIEVQIPAREAFNYQPQSHRRTHCSGSRKALLFLLVLVAAAVGLYSCVHHHFYGNV